MNVSLSLITALLMGGLMILCAGAAIALRGNRTLLWLTLALSGAGAFAIALRFGDSQPGFTAIGIATLAGGYYCVGRAVRLLFSQNDTMHGLHLGVALIALAGAAIEAWGGAEAWQSIALYGAAALAASESVFRLMRVRRRRTIDSVLLVALIGVVAPYIIRIPFLVAMPQTATQGGPWIFGQSLGQLVLASEGMLTTLCVFLLMAKTIGDVISFYRLRSEQDALTGLLNRRSFAERLSLPGMSGALLLCDIDHFKRVNDRFGHPAGDSVIRALAGLFHCTGYPAGRMGGEEFALLLPGFDLDRAERLAEELRLCFESLAINPIPRDYRLSASFGVALFGENESVEAIHARADEALYAAKEAGRNRVMVHHAQANGSIPEMMGALYRVA